MAKRGKIIGGVDVGQLQVDLGVRHPPAEMVAKVNAAVERIGNIEFFKAPGLAFLREAWIAGRFGIARGAKGVRLLAGKFPDFVIDFGDREEEFEAVEADAPERRRGLEYEGDEGGIVHDPAEQWAERARQAPEWIARVCRKKAEKHYGSKAHLVVYLNMGEYGAYHEQVVSSFTEATAPAHGAFASVWVLWKDEAYLAWEPDEPEDLGSTPGLTAPGGNAQWDEATWDDPEWPGRASEKPVPPQGPGPVFDVGNNGLISLARPGAIPAGADMKRLQQLHPELVGAASRLVEKLEGSNAHQDLHDVAARYLATLDQPLSDLQFMALTGIGMQLRLHRAAAMRDDGLSPPLDPTEVAAVDGVLVFHWPFVLAVPEARAFLEDTSDPTSTEQFAQMEPLLRKTVQAFTADTKIATLETRKIVEILGAPPLEGAPPKARVLAAQTGENLLRTMAAEFSKQFSGTMGKGAAGAAITGLGAIGLFLAGQMPTLAQMIALGGEAYAWLIPIVEALGRIAGAG